MKLAVTEWIDGKPMFWALIPAGLLVLAMVGITAFALAYTGGPNVVYEDQDTTCTLENSKVTCRDRATGEVQCTYTVVQGRGGVVYHGCQ